MVYTILKNTLQVSDLATQYDEAAKKLLAQKIILAHILKRNCTRRRENTAYTDFQKTSERKVCRADCG